MRNIRKRAGLFWAVLSFVTALAIIGCGGGGGDASGTLSPEELEVATVIDGFAAAIRSEDAAMTQSFLDSNLRYRRVGTVIDEVGAGLFVARLNTFFAAARVTDFQMANVGINMLSENMAQSRVTLNLAYTDNSDNTRPALIENIELVFERPPGGAWGVLEFGSVSGRSAFPPEL